MTTSKERLRLNEADLLLDTIFAQLHVEGRVAIFDHLAISAATRYELRKWFLKYLRADAALLTCNDYSLRNRLSLARYTAMSQIVHWRLRNAAKYEHGLNYTRLFHSQDWKRFINHN